MPRTSPSWSKERRRPGSRAGQVGRVEPRPAHRELQQERAPCRRKRGTRKGPPGDLGASGPSVVGERVSNARVSRAEQSQRGRRHIWNHATTTWAQPSSERVAGRTGHRSRPRLRWRPRTQLHARRGRTRRPVHRVGRSPGSWPPRRSRCRDRSPRRCQEALDRRDARARSAIVERRRRIDADLQTAERGVPVIHSSGSPVRRRPTSDSSSSLSPAAHARSSSASSPAATNPARESNASSDPGHSPSASAGRIGCTRP